MLPNSIQKLAEEFQKLDGVGKRSSLKLTLDLLQLSDQEYLEFSNLLAQMRDETGFCDRCSFFAEYQKPREGLVLCNICQSKSRNTTQFCLVQNPTDVLTLERSGTYNGLYHCLNNLISPLDNIFAENTTLDRFWLRLESLISKGREVEIIFFFKAGFNADTTMAYIKDILKQKNWLAKTKLTRLAQGLPLYYNPDTLDQATMAKALEDRREI